MKDLKKAYQLLSAERIKLGKNIKIIEKDPVLHDDYNYISNKIDKINEDLIKLNDLIK